MSQGVEQTIYRLRNGAEYSFWQMVTPTPLLSVSSIWKTNLYDLELDEKRIPPGILTEAMKLQGKQLEDLQAGGDELLAALSKSLPTRMDVAILSSSVLWENLPVTAELEIHGIFHGDEVLHLDLFLSSPLFEKIPRDKQIDVKFLNGHPLFAYFTLQRFQRYPRDDDKKYVVYMDYRSFLLNGISRIPPILLDDRDKGLDAKFIKNGQLILEPTDFPSVYYWSEREKGGEICIAEITDLNRDRFAFVTTLVSDEVKDVRSGHALSEGYRWPAEYTGPLRIVTYFPPPFPDGRKASVADILLGPKVPVTNVIDSIPEPYFMQYIGKCLAKSALESQREQQTSKRNALFYQQKQFYRQAATLSKKQPEAYYTAVEFRPKLREGVEKFTCAETRTDLQAGYSLPVVRYPRLYYSQSGPEEMRDIPYCGTFYFFQPDSQMYLNLGSKIGIFATKIHAMLTLLGEDEKHGYRFRSQLIKQYIDRSGPYSKILTEEQKLALLNLLEYNWQENWMITFPGFPPEDARKIQLEFYTQMLEKDTDSHKGVVRNGRLIATLLYPSILGGDLHWDTGIHDYLDQLLCLYGREFGYTTLVLQREKGERRATTEILDVRPYGVQYAYFLTDLPKEPFPYSKRVPTVWFPEFGLANAPGPLKMAGEHTIIVKATECKEQKRCRPPFVGKEAKHCLEVARQWTQMLVEDVARVETVFLNTFGEVHTFTYDVHRYWPWKIEPVEKSSTVRLVLFPADKIPEKNKTFRLLDEVQTALSSLYTQEAHAGGLITLQIEFRGLGREMDRPTIKHLERALRFEQIQIEFPPGTLWTDFAPFAHVQLRAVTSLSFLDLVFDIPFQFPARV